MKQKRDARSWLLALLAVLCFTGMVLIPSLQGTDADVKLYSYVSFCLLVLTVIFTVLCVLRVRKLTASRGNQMHGDEPVPALSPLAAGKKADQRSFGRLFFGTLLVVMICMLYAFRGQSIDSITSAVTQVRQTLGGLSGQFSGFNTSPVGKWYYRMQTGPQAGGLINLTEYWYMVCSSDGKIVVGIKNIGYPEMSQGKGTWAKSGNSVNYTIRYNWGATETGSLVVRGDSLYSPSTNRSWRR